jgi:tetratricopeptide (TPR) repeat protein
MRREKIMRKLLYPTLVIAALASVPHAASADDLQVCTIWRVGDGPAPDLTKVVSACTAVIQSRNPKDVVEGYRNRANAYCGLGDFASAERDFEQLQALDKDPDEVQFDANALADAKMALSDPDITTCKSRKDAYDAAGGVHGS